MLSVVIVNVVVPIQTVKSSIVGQISLELKIMPKLCSVKSFGSTVEFDPFFIFKTMSKRQTTQA